MENITAEEFFRAKIKELNPIQMVVTLANETISGEQGLRWAHEFKELHTTTLQAELEKANQELHKGSNQYALVIVELEKAKELLKIIKDVERGLLFMQLPAEVREKLTTFLEAK